MISFCVPWVALGKSNLFGDSAFIFLYELSVLKYKLHKVKTIFYLHPDYKDLFEERNDPKTSGVYGVYAAEQRLRSRQFDCGVDDLAANKYLTGIVCPVDYIYTNKKMIVPLMAAQGLSYYKREGSNTPVIFQVMAAGIEGFEATETVMNNRLVECRIEAYSYSVASAILWLSYADHLRGMSICKRFLSNSEVVGIKKKYHILGGFLYDGIKKIRKSDAEVKRKLQTPIKEKFKLSFIGRMSANKNVSSIIDAVGVLFPIDSIKLDVVSVGDTILPSHTTTKRFGSTENMQCVIERRDTSGKKGRDHYVDDVLNSLDCVISATVIESFGSTPREVIYTGIPCLLPDNAWATTMFKNKYPFIYHSEEEAISLIRSIRDGAVSNKQCEEFNLCRNEKEYSPFSTDAATGVFSVCKEKVDFVETVVNRFQHSRAVEAFKEVVAVGDTFLWKEVCKKVEKTTTSILIGELPGRRNCISFTYFYKFVKHLIDCVDPIHGVFKRII